jgi:hypothetical protein
MSLADEANELMDWKEPDPSQPELKRLLNFLIGISKQKRQAHVVLATSDYFLASWMTQGGLYLCSLFELFSSSSKCLFLSLCSWDDRGQV